MTDMTTHLLQIQNKSNEGKNKCNQPQTKKKKRKMMIRSNVLGVRDMNIFCHGKSIFRFGYVPMFDVVLSVGFD